MTFQPATNLELRNDLERGVVLKQWQNILKMVLMGMRDQKTIESASGRNFHP